VIETLTRLFDVVTDAPPVSEHEGSLEVCRIVKHDHSTYTTRSDDMTRIEARGADVCTTCVSDRVCRILKECDTWEGFTDRFPIGDVPDQVGEEETLRLWGDNLLKIFDARNIRIETNVTEYWFETKLHERGNGCRKPTRGCYYFGSLWKVEGTKT
jgi:hypothetical protein